MHRFYQSITILVIICINSTLCKEDYVVSIVKSCNYSIEVHNDIQTEDGYLLTMHRLPPKVKEYTDVTRNGPVLLMHGLCGSAENFVLFNCTDSLAYMLLNQGYDVWIGNSRTVSYSRHHVFLNPNSKEYWNISLDDMATYDLPAMIDYILKTTNYKQLMYIGHSQGSLIFYIMSSNKPEYAKKVKLFVNFSPVATLTHLPHPWLGTLCRQMKLLHTIKDIGLYEWTLGRDLIRPIGHYMCSGILKGVCKIAIYAFSGMLPERMHDYEMFNLLRNCPEGIAAKQFIHGCQMYLRKEFMKYDYGSPELNMKHYGVTEPPKYNRSRVTCPTAIYYSKPDWFLHPDDARMIINELPNVVDKFELPDPNFSHFDFLFGRQAPEILYPRILALMNQMSP